MCSKLIELNNVYKTYYSENVIPVHALSGISLSICSGEYVAIMGPSGSGKTTLMNIIGCLDTPTKGLYLFDGQNTSQLTEVELSAIRNKKIGFVFQNFNLLSRERVVENVALPLLYADVSRTERIDRALLTLEKVGLSDHAFFYPPQLSGGQKQRVAIARALINNPDILLADEPTGSLDTVSGTQIMELFHNLNEQGVTVIIITHAPEVAHKTKRIIKIIDGRISSLKD